MSPPQAGPLTVRAFLSVNGICARWDCSRSTAYRAIEEMERGGYLDRIFVGHDQRVSLASIETWERLHSAPPGSDAKRAALATLRHASTQKRRQAANPTTARPSIRDAWRKMKKAG